ncbi:hypothetical protein ACP70R_038060 [Stipagrostis hirtigluma subsp. patula]
MVSWRTRARSTAATPSSSSGTQLEPGGVIECKEQAALAFLGSSITLIGVVMTIVAVQVARKHTLAYPYGEGRDQTAAAVIILVTAGVIAASGLACLGVAIWRFCC